MFYSCSILSGYYRSGRTVKPANTGLFGLADTSAFRLGAGRSQVQILSPRYEERPANEQVGAPTMGTPLARWGTIGEQILLVFAERRATEASLAPAAGAIDRLSPRSVASGPCRDAGADTVT